MKAKILFVVAALAAVGVGAFFIGRSTGRQPATSAGTAAKHAKTLYTCGMHPQVIQDHPGNCPICGMRLTPIRKELATTGATPAATGQRKIKYYKSTMKPGEVRQTPGKDSMGMEMVPVYEDEAAAAESSAIRIDPVTIQDMGLRTGVVKRGPLRRVVRTVAVIDYDETSLADVTTKFGGWIEKLYVNATGDLVMRGQPLFEIYSPELYSAEVEYLLAVNSPTNADSATEGLQTSALTKLKYFDISDQQIAELRRTGQPRKTLPILAPQDGFVVEKDVVEGQMVKAGARIYRLADLGLVWVQADVYEQDLPYIKLGQEATVTLSYLPDRKFRGRVTYIYPSLNEKTRTVRVRMEFHNPGYFLKPGMFASVEIRAELTPSALLVPDSAVLRSGQRDTVFVALAGGRFEPRTVVLGPRAENNMYQVLSGLKAGERVVTSGQFLLDSESQLDEAIQKMIEPGKASNVASTMPATNSSAESAPGSPGAGKVVYVCPMPAHVSIEYDHPGKCPICGMTLVPVTKSVLKKIQPGGRVLYYTCPMPEHSRVHESKPGKCPICGMTLIPVMAAPPAAGTPERGGEGAPQRGPSESKGAGASSMSEAPAAQHPAKQTLYTCPMAQDADVVSDQPGKCPKCGMDLVPTSTVAHGKIAEANWRKQHPAKP